MDWYTLMSLFRHINLKFILAISIILNGKPNQTSLWIGLHPCQPLVNHPEKQTKPSISLSSIQTGRYQTQGLSWPQWYLLIGRKSYRRWTVQCFQNDG